MDSERFPIVRRGAIVPRWTTALSARQAYSILNTASGPGLLVRRGWCGGFEAAAGPKPTLHADREARRRRQQQPAERKRPIAEVLCRDHLQLGPQRVAGGLRRVGEGRGLGLQAPQLPRGFFPRVSPRTRGAPRSRGVTQTGAASAALLPREKQQALVGAAHGCLDAAEGEQDFAMGPVHFVICRYQPLAQRHLLCRFANSRHCLAHQVVCCCGWRRLLDSIPMGFE